MRIKQYDELTFADDFMFCKVLENNEDLCKELVELILDTKIEIVTSVRRQKPIEITERLEKRVYVVRRKVSGVPGRGP